MISRVAVFLVASLLAGCVSNTGVQVPLTSAAIGSDKDLLIRVRVKDGFSSQYHAQDSTGAKSASMAFGGMIGYSIAKSISDSKDNELEQQIAQAIAPFSLEEALSELLVARLADTNRFAKVGPWSASENGQGALVMDVDVSFWGLRQCVDEQISARMWIDTEVSLNDPLTPKPLWKLVQAYQSRNGCHYLEEYHLDANLTLEEIHQLVDTVAFRVSNEIRYAR